MRLFLTLIMVVISTISFADTNSNILNKIQQNLKLPTILQCNFHQERKIQNISQPLRSSGEIIFERKKGVVFSQLLPFKQDLIMTPNKIYQSINGQKQIITIEQQPQLFHFIYLLSNLIQGNWQEIDKTFMIKNIKFIDKQWQVILVPLQSPLNKIFQSIELNGNSTITKVILIDKQQDYTEINFNQCHSLAKLSEQQNAQFKN